MAECPNCHLVFEPQLKCLRCGHKWVQRGITLPKVCPHPECKSPYWNKLRKNDSIIGIK